MNEIVVGLVALVLLLGLFLTGIELAFAMAIIGFAGFAYLQSFDAAVGMLANDFLDSVGSYSFTVVPLFVLMGQIAFNAGIAKRLYDSAHKFMGHVPGGLAIATIAGATVFKSICGSVAATSATFASVAVPEMDRFGYSRKLSTGIVAIAGTLGVLLPPSVTLIIFGIVTQLSIGRLFLAGILPGLLIALLFVAVSYGWCRMNPEMGPRSGRFTWKERTLTVPGVIWPIVIFALVIGGLMKGLFTPTEAGSIGAFIVLVLCVVKKDLDFRGYCQALSEALGTSCMVLAMVACSTVLGHLIAVTDIPQAVAGWTSSLSWNRSLIMGLILFIYLVGGSFIDDVAFMILATPIFFPAIINLGYDPIWAGIMVALTVAIGSVVPPVALCVFVVKNITKESMGVIYRGCYPFLIALLVAVIVVFVFPSVALYLPNLLMK
ncbi:MAG: Sialic acid TRAP transporter permease protein SiaT [Syntrophorhabdaceae bacterium PtaU1.Bin034]|nr:MAG: Sialic acid TRAP transporter permease protein SiaT [Syntrophorhabdaceae bacterium PtaU1.Bin034]